MKNRRKQERIAKILLKKSLTEDGTIDAKKIKLILSEVIRQTPPQFINILKIYKKLVTNSLASEELTVETAQKLSNQKQFEKNILAKTGAKRINYKINPNLVFGTKITHGDWVFDETLQAKLNNLTNSDY